MLQTKLLPLSILLPLATAAPSPHPKAHTTALLTANFYPNCPASSGPDSDSSDSSRVDYDPSPSLSFNRNNHALDVSSHYEITSTAPLAPNVCVGIPVPLEYSSLLVDHFSVEAAIQHHGKEKEKCKITVHELPGCAQEPVLEVEIGEGERSVESGCVRRKFLAFELVWARLDCEVEEDDHDDHDDEDDEDEDDDEHKAKEGVKNEDEHKAKDEDKDSKKPWTQHGGLANSTAPASQGTKGRLSGGKRRTKLPIF